jgi:hypothetical protein
MSEIPTTDRGHTQDGLQRLGDRPASRRRPHAPLRQLSCGPRVFMSCGRTSLGRPRHPAARTAPRGLCDHGPAAFWLHWIHGTPRVVAAQQHRRVESTPP